MRVLVNGAGGQLGNDVVAVLSDRCDVLGLDRAQWDITDAIQSQEILSTYNPDVVIHCAAFTNVDRSEGEPDIAYDVNVKGTRDLASLCGREKIRFVYISTDYVFDGLAKEGYTEGGHAHPLNVYGRTKRLGEKWTMRCAPNHLILRTSWLYGAKGHNFVHTILKKARMKEPLSIVTDQYGSPTYTLHVAKQLERLLQTDATGIFHVSNTGSCSWFAFAHAILEIAEIQHPLERISSDQLVRKAIRPNYSILRSDRFDSLGITPMAHWKKALEEFIKGGLTND